MIGQILATFAICAAALWLLMFAITVIADLAFGNDIDWPDNALVTTKITGVVAGAAISILGVGWIIGWIWGAA